MAAAAKTTAMAWSSLLLLSTLATVHVDGATGGGGNAGAPAPSVDCTDALLSLAGCLSYVQEGSTVAKPDESCCSGLKDVVRKEVACLCQAFQGSQNFGVTLNMTKALQLPSACKVKTPPFSKCHLSIPGVTDGAPVLLFQLLPHSPGLRFSEGRRRRRHLRHHRQEPEATPPLKLHPRRVPLQPPSRPQHASSWPL